MTRHYPPELLTRITTDIPRYAGKPRNVALAVLRKLEAGAAGVQIAAGMNDEAVFAFVREYAKRRDAEDAA